MSTFKTSIGRGVTQDWLNKQSYETLSILAEMLWKTHTIKVEWSEMSEEDVKTRCQEWGVDEGDNIWHSRNRLRACNDDEATSDDEETGEETGEETDEETGEESGGETGEESGDESEEEDLPPPPEVRSSWLGLDVEAFGTHLWNKGVSIWTDVEKEMTQFSDDEGWLYGIGTLHPELQGDDERGAWNNLEMEFYKTIQDGGNQKVERNMDYDDLHELAAKRGLVEWDYTPKETEADAWKLIDDIQTWNVENGYRA